MCSNTICQSNMMAGRVRRAWPIVVLCLLVGYTQAAGAEIVLPNDNTRPAGIVEGQHVTIRLRAAQGSWRPEGPGGPALFCGIAGYQLPLPPDRMKALYRNRNDYRRKVEQRTNALIKEGWISPAYKDLILSDAAKVPFP